MVLLARDSLGMMGDGVSCGVAWCFDGGMQMAFEGTKIRRSENPEVPQSRNYAGPATQRLSAPATTAASVGDDRFRASAMINPTYLAQRTRTCKAAHRILKLYRC